MTNFTKPLNFAEQIINSEKLEEADTSSSIETTKIFEEMPVAPKIIFDKVSVSMDFII
tara:strand:+ start:184 stop:357 length:174 start_codon:yes stop_codon:yes gene_type:complete